MGSKYEPSKTESSILKGKISKFLLNPNDSHTCKRHHSALKVSWRQKLKETAQVSQFLGILLETKTETEDWLFPHKNFRSRRVWQ